MRPLGRPIGVWIAMAYLLAVAALAVVTILTEPISTRSLFVVLAFIVLLSGVVLLSCLNRWAMLATAIQAALQAGSYLAYLGANQSHAIERLGSPNIVVYLVQYNFAPLAHLVGTFAVLLYTAWLWRTGILR